MDPMGTDCLGILFAVRLWWVRKLAPCATDASPECARTVIGLSSVIVVQAQEPTDGFRD